MARTAIRRDGLDRSVVHAAPPTVLDALADPSFVTSAIGDLVDQERSHAGERPRWVVPRLRVAGRGVAVVLEPTWQVAGGTVTIDAVSTPQSDADVRLRLACSIEQPAATPPPHLLSIAWDLHMWVPLPRTLVRLAAPALDHTVTSVVERITTRITAAVEER